MRRLKRRHKVLIGFGIVIALLIVAWVVLDLLASAAVRREVAKIEAAGETVNFEDLIPPPIPDEENAALVYEEAFSLLEILGSDTEDVLIRALSDPAPWTEEKQRHWARWLDGRQERISAITEAAAWEAAKACLVRNRAALDLIRKASSMKACRFEVEYDLPTFWVAVPGLMGVRSAAELLALSARVRHHDGDTLGAYDDVVHGLRMERGTRQPDLTACMLGHGVVVQMLNSGLQLVLSEDASHPQQWRRILDELNAIDRQASLVLALQAERAVMAWFIGKYAWDPIALKRISADERLPRPSVRGGVLRPAARFDEAVFLRHMNKILHAARQDPHEALAAVSEIDRDAANISRWAFATRMLVPGCAGALDSSVGARTDVVLARVALALKLYKHQHGTYPDSLSALSPGILKTVPSDPFTGTPLIYRRQGDGFLLYSVWRDLEDNNGLERLPGAKDPPDAFDRVWKAAK